MEPREQIKLELLELVNKGQLNTSYLDQKSIYITHEAQIVRGGLHTDGCFNVIPKENGSYDYMISSQGINVMKHLQQVRNDEQAAREKLKYDTQLVKEQVRTQKYLFWIAVVGGVLGLASFILQLFHGLR